MEIILLKGKEAAAVLWSRAGSKVFSAAEKEYLESVSGTRTVNYRFEKDRALHLTGILLAEFGAALFDGCTHAMKTGKYGKPSFADSSLSFNISHSGDIAVCAFSLDSVGVDVEYPRRNIEDILRHFCKDEERAWALENGYSEEKAYRLWSYKESFLKREGRSVGEIRELDSFVKDGRLISVYGNTRFFEEEISMGAPVDSKDNTPGKMSIVLAAGKEVKAAKFREIEADRLSSMLQDLQKGSDRSVLSAYL